jgi:hypothetical protein
MEMGLQEKPPFRRFQKIFASACFASSVEHLEVDELERTSALGGLHSSVIVSEETFLKIVRLTDIEFAIFQAAEDVHVESRRCGCHLIGFSRRD